MVTTWSNTLFVSDAGSDTTGDGSPTNPFATYSHCITVIGSSATETNEYTVMFLPGTYSQNIALSPFVWVSGLDGAGTSIFTGNFTLLNTFAGPASPAIISGISNATVSGNVDLNFAGIGSYGGDIQMFNAFFEGTFTVEGFGDGYNEFGPLYTGFNGNLTIKDAQLNSEFCQIGGTLAISAPSHGAAWYSAGDTVGSSVSLDGSTGYNCTGSLVGTAVTGNLTLNGSKASYTCTSEGVGNGLVLTGGASAPTLSTGAIGLGYAPGVLSNWAGSSSPKTVKSALDRIAAALATLGQKP